MIAFFDLKKIRKFSIFLEIEKTIIFGTKLVQNHHIDLNLTKFSPKTPKKCQFSHKTLKFFKIFGAFGAENLEF